MKKFVFIFALMMFATSAIFSQQISINELFNGSAQTDEWIELLVVQDGLDIRGWDLRDFSSTGGPQAPLVFSSNSLWSNLKSGTLIVITQVTTHIEDFDASDYVVTIKTSNSTYFSGNPFNIAGASDAIQIRNASQTHIFGVSWGTANATSIPSPKVHFTGASTSNTTTFFNGDNVSQLTTVGNWSQNSLTITRGSGNTVANSAW
ncbi:MAG: hypothetical protein ABIK27_05895, partial [Bacteroidota bacterium]